MDVSSVGVANSAQYLQKATSGSQAPLTPIKQEEQAAQVFAQVVAQSPQPQQQQPKAVSPEDVGKSGVGQILDVQA
ncbi:hypothetical protein CU669_06245 [Paramagnetospirillum kuznetsovii]|uniref:Uncharacterized protein n=1 Tax=Paramagnetospirillum kuznetsovii TaxID=2053833 RepID=A0A364P1D6_9PROT|nr:hypothetical protein [Paramagnetospirillum kuznetsovii]RAU23070.1 hypothetical protein CU669_06245 [Paramagnetospirillum kuznetsovii]